MLTNELVTVNKELKNMLLEMTPNELQAIKQISNQFNSSNYRGDLLFKLFAYFEHKFIETGNYEISPEFQDIHYTFKIANNGLSSLVILIQKVKGMLLVVY